MRILIITSSFPRSLQDSRNAGVFVLQFAQQLISQGHQVQVLTPDKSGNKGEFGFPVKFFPTLGGETELVNLNARNPIDLLRLVALVVGGIWHAIHATRGFQPDMTLACWAVPSGIWARAAQLVTGTPYATWALGSDVWKIKRYPAGPAILRSVLNHASVNFADGIELSRIVSSYGGRTCEFLPSTRTLPAPAHPGPRDSNLLVMISRLHPDKGPDILLQAFAQARKSSPDLRLELYGGGPMEAQLKQLIHSLGLEGAVALRDYLDQQGVADTLSRVSALVIPSRIESIPLVFSEAIQANCPAIVTDVGDMGTLCRTYNFGLVAERPVPEALAEKIVEFIGLSDRTKLLAPPEARELFDGSRIVQRFLSAVSAHSRSSAHDV